MKRAFGGKKGGVGVSGAPPFAKKSGGGNPFAGGGNPFAAEAPMKKGGRVKKAAGGIIKGGTGSGAPNGNSWKNNDSPKKPFAATRGGMKKGGRAC